jgi:4-amino-4-deoxy-L-arabinose transferase-like glycosyltransferase
MAKARTDLMQGTSHRWNVFLLGIIAALILLWKLGGPSLAPWDEAIYAQVSKEIAQGKGWLTLHWADQPWFEKPPLMMWITAVLYRLFGVSEFWARSVSAFSGIGLVMTTYFIGAFAYGKRAGLLAAMILLTCYHFLSFARFGTMEIMLTLFTYLAVYGYLRLSGGNEKWWYMIWLCIALGLLTKGAGGLIALAVVLLALVFDSGLRSAIESRHFWLGCFLALLVIVPWHAVMYARYERAFIDEYVRYHVIARSIRTLEGHPSSYFYYLGKLVDGFFPWILIVPFAIIQAVRRAIKGESPSRALLLTALLVFGIYTIIPTRRPWYIVPIYPALAILIA